MTTRYGIAHDGNWFCGFGAFFPGPVGWFLTLLFWAVVIYLVVKIFQAMFNRNSASDRQALEILKERYARGELSDEEFRRMKSELV